MTTITAVEECNNQSFFERNAALPSNWHLATIGSLSKDSLGTINPLRNPEERFEYYSIPSFQSTGKPTVEVGSRILSNKLVVANGTVLFGKLNPRVLKVWLVDSHSDYRKIASTEFLPILPNDSATSDFIYYICHSDFVVSEARRLVSGSTPSRQRVEPSAFYSIEIPVPPVSEQVAITEALKSVQRAKNARDLEVRLERELKAALLEHLFTYGTERATRLVEDRKFGRTPADWKIMGLQECAFIQTGVAKGRKLNDADAISVPYLRVANVQDGFLNLSEMKTIQIRQSELKRFLLQNEDVVLTEGGDFDKLGRGFVWRGEVTPCIHQNHIFAVRANRDLLSPEFLAYLVQSPYGRSYFLTVAHKTTNLACINKTKLGNFPTLLPSLEEQVDIATILGACDAKIMALESESRFLNELFRLMLEQFMSGHLEVKSLLETEAQV
jgi:type I restriction enzyme, S subunit